MDYCVFCEIIARRERGTIRYEDDDVIVIDNILRWVPIMLLAMPKKHMTQDEMWRDSGGIGRVAVEMGNKHCPGGFRLVSNFGRDAMQSQTHAHLHILGGAFLGHYV
jgi:histidine triad (HIT) family protein